MTSAEFLAKIDRSGGPTACWPHLGWRDSEGRGEMKHEGKRWRAHRLAYTLLTGPIPSGLHVLHACDNPACCNPAHLHVGTHQDNMREAQERCAKRKGANHWSARMPERVQRGENHYLKRNPGQRVGEKNSCAKLTEAQVRAILADPAASARSVAVAYGVSESLIYAIRSGRAWPHLTAEPQSHDT